MNEYTEKCSISSITLQSNKLSSPADRGVGDVLLGHSDMTLVATLWKSMEPAKIQHASSLSMRIGSQRPLRSKSRAIDAADGGSEVVVKKKMTFPSFSSLSLPPLYVCSARIRLLQRTFPALFHISVHSMPHKLSD